VIHSKYFHRITECLGFKGTLKAHSVPTPCHGQSWAEAAQLYVISCKLPENLFPEIQACSYLPFRHSLQCKSVFPMHCYLPICFCLFCFPSLGGNILTVSCKQKAKQNGAAKKHWYIKLRKVSFGLLIAYCVKSRLLMRCYFLLCFLVNLCFLCQPSDVYFTLHFDTVNI